MDDTKMLLVALFFVLVVGILTATYTSSVGEIKDKEGNVIDSDAILWGNVPEDTEGIFGSEKVYHLIVHNADDWKTIKNSEWVILLDEDFKTIFNVTEDTAQEKYGTEYRYLRLNTKISYENETIEKIVVPSSYQFVLSELPNILMTYTVRFRTDPLEKGVLELGENETKPKGAPAWYDVPGWLGYLWNMFGPVLTFQLFGGNIKTGLPPWLNLTLSALVSTIFYAIVILFLVKLVRGV